MWKETSVSGNWETFGWKCHRNLISIHQPNQTPPPIPPHKMGVLFLSFAKKFSCQEKVLVLFSFGRKWGALDGLRKSDKVNIHSFYWWQWDEIIRYSFSLASLYTRRVKLSLLVETVNLNSWHQLIHIPFRETILFFFDWHRNVSDFNMKRTLDLVKFLRNIFFSRWINVYFIWIFI